MHVIASAIAIATSSFLQSANNAILTIHRGSNTRQVTLPRMHTHTHNNRMPYLVRMAVPCYTPAITPSATIFQDVNYVLHVPMEAG
jgi:hypothetical protein